MNRIIEYVPRIGIELIFHERKLQLINSNGQRNTIAMQIIVIIYRLRYPFRDSANATAGYDWPLLCIYEFGFPQQLLQFPLISFTFGFSVYMITSVSISIELK